MKHYLFIPFFAIFNLHNFIVKYVLNVMMSHH